MTEGKFFAGMGILLVTVIVILLLAAWESRQNDYRDKALEASIVIEKARQTPACECREQLDAINRRLIQIEGRLAKP